MQMSNTTISETMLHCADLTESGIESYFESIERSPLWSEELSPLLQAMKYSIFAGGKRIRPFLAMQFAAICGKSGKSAQNYAAALEMVHTYSLIHDDLPCMDNDDLRRGRPTNHKVYGEATALLAGDSLLTHAFEVIADAPLTCEQNMKAVKVLSHCAGVLGMAGGQEIDLDSEGKEISSELLYRLHAKKTGAMIKASCLLGCIAAGVFEDDRRYAAAEKYAEEIGIAFQIVDDILDVVGNDAKLGKHVGSDKRCGKTTYVTLYGIDGARSLAKKHVANAKDALLGVFDELSAKNLCEIAQFIVEREN